MAKRGDKKPKTNLDRKAARKRKAEAALRAEAEKSRDDNVMFWFCNHLMTYFGDNGYDDEIIASLHGTFSGYPFVAENFRRGLDIAIRLPGKDRRKIVKHYANRRAQTVEQATAWLVNLRDKLFGA